MSARPVVLFSTGPLKDGDNPYLHQLVEHLADQAEIRFLTPLTAVRGRFDVLHVHWPHQLVHGATRLRCLLKTVAAVVLLARVRRRRVPVVLTMHNLGSHEQAGFAERWVVRRLERLVSIRILLNDSADNDLRRGVVALHPDYREWLAGLPDVDPPATGDALLFGNLRPYKGIEDLLSAAAASGVPTTVAGRPLDDDYADALRVEAASAGVRLLPTAYDEAELAALVRAHRLVVLPYRSMYNSGALLYALSAGVPVLAPTSPANVAIAQEVGPAWLRLYDGPLTAAVLESTLRRLGEPPAEGPDLDRRDWPTHADLHSRIYRTVEASSPSERIKDPVVDQVRNRRALVADAAFGSHSRANAEIRYDNDTADSAEAHDHP